MFGKKTEVKKENKAMEENKMAKRTIEVNKGMNKSSKEVKKMKLTKKELKNQVEIGKTNFARMCREAMYRGVYTLDECVDFAKKSEYGQTKFGKPLAPLMDMKDLNWLGLKVKKGAKAKGCCEIWVMPTDYAIKVGKDYIRFYRKAAAEEYIKANKLNCKPFEVAKMKEVQPELKREYLFDIRDCEPSKF